MLRSRIQVGVVAAVAFILAAAGIGRAVAGFPGAGRCLPAAVSVEVKDAGGKTLRTVTGTLVKEGLIVQTSALAGASATVAHTRDGLSWNADSLLISHPIVGLTLLKLPMVPDYALSLPENGAFMPGSKVAVLGRPGSSPDSVTATIYYTFSLRDGTDYVSAYPGLPGAAPVVDPNGRLLGVMSDLSAGGISVWSVVPTASVRALVTARGLPQPLTGAADLSGPPYEDPRAALGLAFRGASLVTANQTEDARTLLSSALKKDSTNVDAHFWLGRLLFMKQQFEDAAREFTAAGRLDPSFSLAWHMSGASYNQAGRYLEAEKMYGKALEANPRSAGTYCNLGGAYFNEHRYDKAAEAFRKSIELDPRYERGLAYTNLAQTLVTQGKRTEAETVYQNLLRVDPEWAKRLRAILDGKPVPR